MGPFAGLQTDAKCGYVCSMLASVGDAKQSLSQDCLDLLSGPVLFIAPLFLLPFNLRSSGVKFCKDDCRLPSQQLVGEDLTSKSRDYGPQYTTGSAIFCYRILVNYADRATQRSSLPISSLFYSASLNR